MSSANDPDPLTEPAQLPGDDQLGESDDEPGGSRHRGPSDDATADIEERQDTSLATLRDRTAARRCACVLTARRDGPDRHDRPPHRRGRPQPRGHAAAPVGAERPASAAPAGDDRYQRRGRGQDRRRAARARVHRRPRRPDARHLRVDPRRRVPRDRAQSAGREARAAHRPPARRHGRLPRLHDRLPGRPGRAGGALRDAGRRPLDRRCRRRSRTRSTTARCSVSTSASTSRIAPRITSTRSRTSCSARPAPCSAAPSRSRPSSS